MTLEQIRNGLEIAYFLSGIGVAVAAILGLQQLRIMKLDMRTRNERAAKEKAVEFADRYMSIYVPLSSKVYDERKAANLPSYGGPIGDFTAADLLNLDQKIVRARFALGWLPALNALESIASAFVTGVADEQTGFSIMGRSFCATVAIQYDIICVCRDDDACRHWESIVSLYCLWSSRLTKAELEAHRARLDEKIAATVSRQISPIGM